MLSHEKNTDFIFLSLLLLITSCPTGTPPVYTLATDVSPSEAGIVEPSSAEFDNGTQVEITANSNEHWVFVEWTGDYVGIENPVQVTVDEHVNVTVVFENTPFEGGDRSEQNPYLVSTIDQLQEIRNYPDHHFMQINDIDAGETVHWTHEGGFKGFDPLGTQSNPYSGSYDGNGFEIKGLFIESGTVGRSRFYSN